MSYTTDFDHLLASAPREVLGAAIVTEQRAADLLRAKFTDFVQAMHGLLSVGRHDDAMAACRKAAVNEFYNGLRQLVADEQGREFCVYEHGIDFAQFMAAMGSPLMKDDTPGSDGDGDSETQEGTE